MHGSNTFIAPGDVVAKLGIQPGMYVAHLGCGSTGSFAVLIARQVGADGKVYVVDIMQSALQGTLEQARIEGVDTMVEPVWSNLELYGVTKIPELTLDIALLINVLFQTEATAVVLREAARLVRSGGRVVVIDWKDEKTPFGPLRGHRVIPQEIISAAALSGLTLIRRMNFGQYHFGLEFEKK